MIRSTAKKISSGMLAFALTISLNGVVIGAGALSFTLLGATSFSGSAANAAPINVVSNGWALTVPDLNFEKSSWTFLLTPQSPNFFDTLDSLNFTLKDSKGKTIGTSYDFADSARQANLELTIYVSASDFSSIDTTNPFVATAELKRGYDSKQSNLSLTFKVPLTSLPKKPANLSDFIKFTTDVSKQELPFPTNCTAYEFKYSINDPFTELSEVDFALKDATGKSIATDYATSRDLEVQKSEFNICANDVRDAVAPFSFVTVLNFYDGSGRSALTSTLKVPSNNFPKRPTSFADYLTMKTDLATKEIPYPKSCSPFEYQYQVSDPYEEISSVTFTLLDAQGAEVASDFDFPESGKLTTGSISICDYSVAKAVAPLTLKASIKFSSGSGKLALDQTFAVKLENPALKYLATLNSQGVVCLKGTTYSVVKSGTCPSGAKAVLFTEPTDVQWNVVTRSPAQAKGKNYIIFGCVAQFDANTGGSKFRAYASKTPSVSWLSGVNSIFTGNAKSFLKLKENDSFVAKVNVSGATSYSTIGNKTTVPAFEVRDFAKIGSC